VAAGSAGWFVSPSRGRRTLEGMYRDLVEYMAEDPAARYKLIVGSDSQLRQELVFVTAVVCHRLGKGARYYYQRVRHRRMASLRQRIFYETSLSLEVAGDLSRLFAERGWRTVAAFQTRNVPHLGHEFVQKMAALQTDGLLIHPVLGEKKAGDFRDEVILAAYRALVDGYHRPDRTVLATMAYTMRYAGPKEAIHHAIVRKNFGASHFCVGRDHAGVGAFYDPLAAQREFARYPDLGVTPVPIGEVHLCLRCGGVVAADTCPHGGDEVRPFSGTRLRRLLTEGGAELEELVRPEVAAVVRSFSRPFVAGAR